MSYLGALWTVSDAALLGVTILLWTLSGPAAGSKIVTALLSLLVYGIAYLIFLVGTLGGLGILAPQYISTALLFGCAVTVFITKRRGGRVDFALPLRMIRSWKEIYEHRTPGYRILAGTAGLVLVALGIVAAFSVPLVIDDLAYRLPRIGYWLQEQSTASFPTFNERMNYMPRGGELIQLWLLAHFSSGYPLCAIVGWLGAVLLCLSTIAWASHLRLGPAMSVVAGLLVLATPVVISQTTTAQTDLLAAGLFNAAFYLFWRSLRCSRWTVLPAIGVASGLATKGTIWFALPSSVVFAAGMVYLYRVRLRMITLHVLACSLAVGVLCGPSWLANIERYGNLFGPPTELARFRDGTEKVGLVEKVRYNAPAWAIQNFASSANLPFASDIVSNWGIALARPLLRGEPHGGSLVGPARLAFISAELKSGQVRMETLSFGILPSLLFCGALIPPLFLAAKRRVFSLGLCFCLWLGSLAAVFIVQVAWQPFAFRFFVIGLPIAWVLVLEGLYCCTGKYGLPIIGGILAIQTVVAVNIFDNDIRSGSEALSSYGSNLVYSQSQQQAAFVRGLPSTVHSLSIALNDHPNQPGIAGFLRTGSPVSIHFAAHESFGRNHVASLQLSLLKTDALIAPQGVLYIRSEDTDIWRIDAPCLRRLHAECFVRMPPEEAAKFLN